MSDSNFNQSAPGKKGFKSKYNDYTYGFGLEVGANIGENNILKFAHQAIKEMCTERVI